MLSSFAIHSTYGLGLKLQLPRRAVPWEGCPKGVSLSGSPHSIPLFPCTRQGTAPQACGVSPLWKWCFPLLGGIVANFCQVWTAVTLGGISSSPSNCYSKAYFSTWMAGSSPCWDLDLDIRWAKKCLLILPCSILLALSKKTKNDFIQQIYLLSFIQWI